MPREYSAAMFIDLPARELLLATRPLTLFAEKEYREEGYVFDFFFDRHDNQVVTDVIDNHLCLGSRTRDIPLYEPDEYHMTLRLDAEVLDSFDKSIHFTQFVANNIGVATDGLAPLVNFPMDTMGEMCQLGVERREKTPPQHCGYAIFVPGVNEYNWPVEKWVEFVQMFCSCTKIPIVMPLNLMVKREIEAFDGLCVLKKMESIWELAWYVLNARVVFTVESWFAHFVAALDVPLLILGLRKHIRGYQYSHHAIRYLIGPPIQLRPEDVVSKAVVASRVYDSFR